MDTAQWKSGFSHRWRGRFALLGGADENATLGVWLPGHWHIPRMCSIALLGSEVTILATINGKWT